MKYLIPCFILLSGCASNYQLSTFYVKNNTDKPMSFKASVELYSSTGPQVRSLPFAVLPKDSVLARVVKLRKDLPPTAWFTKFITFPKDSVTLNDPLNADNWIKTTDAKGRPVYTFNLAR